MNINLSDEYINKKIQKCKEVFLCNNEYEKNLLNIKKISKIIECELNLEQRSRFKELQEMTNKINVIENNLTYKMGVIDGIKEKNSVFN